MTEVREDLQLRELRGRLKLDLIEKRGTFTTQGWKPICPICGLPIQIPDLHEVILTRGDASRAGFATLLAIMVEENCCLVHPSKCHDRAVTREGQTKCILQLIMEVGQARMIAWLKSMEERGLLKGQIDGAQRLIQSVTVQPAAGAI